MQIFAGSPRMWSRSLYDHSLAKSFRDKAEAKDLFPVYIHALYLTNLASNDPELRAKSREALITDMTNSAAINSSGVVLHIGSHQGRGFDQVKNTVAEEIRAVLESTPSTSLLLLENSAGQQGKIGALPELNTLLSFLDSSRVKICLDTAHAFESGYDLRTEEGLALFLSDIKKHLGLENLSLLHLNDSRTKLASAHDQHENIGDGYIGSSGLGRVVNHPDLAHLPLILEVPGVDKSGPDKANIARVRDLLG